MVLSVCQSMTMLKRSVHFNVDGRISGVSIRQGSMHCVLFHALCFVP